MPKRIIYILAVFTLCAVDLYAQAPPDAAYHVPTIRPYANLLLTMPDGSHREIPFTPLIINNSPAGIRNYTEDIDIRARMVFAGTGIVAPDQNYNSFGTYNLRGRIAVIIYNIPFDFQRRYGERSDLHIRVREAEIRGAEAVVFFGVPGNEKWNEPFVTLPETVPVISIPVFTVSYENGMSLLNDAGIELNFSGDRKNVVLKEFEPVELPLIARITLKGNFRSVQTEHFSAQFLPGILTTYTIRKFLEDLEFAVVYLKQIINSDELGIQLQSMMFFPDYTSLKYYTYLDSDIKTDFGHFRVFPDNKALAYRMNYPSIVLDLQRNLVGNAWGISIEGIERATSVMISEKSATEVNLDIDYSTAEMLKAQNQIHFADILFNRFDNTNPRAMELETAAASFLKYLARSYSLERFRNLYTGLSEKPDRRERIMLFEEIYSRDLQSLENEWIEMLAMKYNIPGSMSDAYMDRERGLINFILSGRTR